MQTGNESKSHPFRPRLHSRKSVPATTPPHALVRMAVEEEEEMDPQDSASRVFCSRILSMVNTDDVNAIILAQKNMLDRFEKTNEMLLNFNNLSSVRLQQMSERFVHHTRTLVEMKRDLDSIFRRIRGK
ncbi:hypothetical protein MC885_019502 [Smutsia gigantea]|nr:hypothetical protein MC885_019502 [Smutsia gigantea]